MYPISGEELVACEALRVTGDWAEAQLTHVLFAMRWHAPKDLPVGEDNIARSGHSATYAGAIGAGSSRPSNRSMISSGDVTTIA